MQNAAKSTLQSIITKFKGKKLRTSGLGEKTTYKTESNSLEFRIINKEGKIPKTHNLVRKSDFTIK